MEMFLMAAVMSLLGVAVSAALFAAATRDEGARPASPAKRVEIEPRHFFAAQADAAPGARPGPEAEPIPVEALLLRIEQHIRLEQAAAESFLHTPSGQSLHSRTTSRLVN